MTTATVSKEKVKNYSAVSPTGVFHFPKLVEPDYGTAQYPKQDGEYNVRLALPEAEAKLFRQTLNDSMEVARNQALEKFEKLSLQSRKKLVSPKSRELGVYVFDRNTEQPTGEIEFRFSTKASGTDVKTGEKWEKKVPLFDAKGNSLENVTDIWNGTVGKVAFEAVPYFVNATGEYGLTLRMKAVQVLDLRSPTGSRRDAKGYGFSVEDTGYEHKPVAEVNLQVSTANINNDLGFEVGNVVEDDNVPF